MALPLPVTDCGRSCPWELAALRFARRETIIDDTGEIAWRSSSTPIDGDTTQCPWELAASVTGDVNGTAQMPKVASVEIRP